MPAQANRPAPTRGEAAPGEPFVRTEPAPDAGVQDPLDAFAAARVSAWTFKEKVIRALWMVVRAGLFRTSWHNWYAYRRLLLRLFGAKLGYRVNIRPTAHVEIPWLLEMHDYATVGDHAIIYNLGKITIGKRVTISQYAHLCAGSHDFTRPDFPLLRPPIVVEDDAWVAADAFVGPGVRVGEGAILGARASAFKDLKPWTIYAGNPASPVRERPRFANEAISAGQPA